MVPNPSAGESLLQVQGLEAGTYQVSVWNLQGMPVYNQAVFLSEGVHALPVSLPSALPAGVYVVQLYHTDRGQLAGQARWLITE
jgi:uncharacterized protein YfaS (alpha-2-macroglobulin family)